MPIRVAYHRTCPWPAGPLEVRMFRPPSRLFGLQRTEIACRRKDRETCSFCVRLSSLTMKSGNHRPRETTAPQGALIERFFMIFLGRAHDTSGIPPIDSPALHPHVPNARLLVVDSNDKEPSLPTNSDVLRQNITHGLPGAVSQLHIVDDRARTGSIPSQRDAASSEANHRSCIAPGRGAILLAPSRFVFRESPVSQNRSPTIEIV